MHDWVTHNLHYATFNQFTEAIFDFFRTTLPAKWPEFRDTVTNRQLPRRIAHGIQSDLRVNPQGNSGVGVYLLIP
jgi:hypothetical protein